MDKKKLFDLLYVILIISLIVFMIWIANFMKSNAKECLKDPINYFEEKNEGAECYCTKEGVAYGDQTPNFNINQKVFKE